MGPVSRMESQDSVGIIAYSDLFGAADDAELSLRMRSPIKPHFNQSTVKIAPKILVTTEQTFES